MLFGVEGLQVTDAGAGAGGTLPRLPSWVSSIPDSAASQASANRRHRELVLTTAHKANDILSKIRNHAPLIPTRVFNCIFGAEVRCECPQLPCASGPDLLRPARSRHKPPRYFGGLYCPTVAPRSGIAAGFPSFWVAGCLPHLSDSEPARLFANGRIIVECSATIWMRNSGDLDENYLAAM